VQATTRNLDELAAKLGRPPSALAGLQDLEPEQIALLTERVEATIARRRRDLDVAFARAVPARPLRAAVLAFLRRRAR
jgi:hypothetical protein